jgi:YidC/Oxa1 family membrane protein insertase
MPLLANVIENAFGPLITLFEEILVFIHEHILGPNLSWGWAILGLTVVVRLVLFPLFVRQMKSIVSLQRHMPEMKSIQEKYKDDKQRQSEELMKFYRENNINPFASCLPLILQFPVLISLFYMLRTDLKKHICGPELISHYNNLPLHVRAGYHALHVSSTAHLPSKYLGNTSCEMVAPHSAKFLFIPDLTTKATGWVLGVLLLAYVVTMVASSLLSTATADRNQRLMAIFLPLVFTVIIIGFPAGLVVYWIATNVWTIGQGWLIRRRMPPVATAPAGAAAGARSPGAGRTRAGPKASPGGGDGKGDDAQDGAAATVAREPNGSGESAPSGLLDKVKVAAGRGQSGGDGGSGGENGATSAPETAPPPPPPPRRRKKKRSGRRR